MIFLNHVRLKSLDAIQVLEVIVTYKTMQMTVRNYHTC